MSTTKLYILMLMLFFQSIGSAQEIKTGVDLVSKYVWRGLDITNSPSIQPAISISEYGFELGIWGAYSISSDESVSNEIDGWLSYSVNSSIGEISLSIVDYYFPNAGLQLGNFKSENGAHTLEGTFSYSGPVSIIVTYNFYNDPGNNIYFEIGYPIHIADLSVDFFLGATPGSKVNPDYYDANNFSVINTGVKVSKEIKITEDYTLPIFSSLVVNPRHSIAHLVFGISL